jgi:hypothetical protein
MRLIPAALQPTETNVYVENVDGYTWIWWGKNRPLDEEDDDVIVLTPEDMLELLGEALEGDLTAEEVIKLAKRYEE